MPLESGGGDGEVVAIGGITGRGRSRLGQPEKMSRAQDEGTVFHGKLAYGLRHVTSFARQTLQFVHDASRAIERPFNLGHDRCWRWLAWWNLGGFLFHFLQRFYLL